MVQIQKILTFIMQNIDAALVAIYNAIYEIHESIMFAFATSAVTALLSPRETVGKTLRVALATTILGTVVGESIEQMVVIAAFKYPLVSLVGLYGNKIYDYLSVKMTNPLAFWREVKNTENEN